MMQIAEVPLVWLVQTRDVLKHCFTQEWRPEAVRSLTGPVFDTEEISAVLSDMHKVCAAINQELERRYP